MPRYTQEEYNILYKDLANDRNTQTIYVMSCPERVDMFVEQLSSNFMHYARTEFVEGNSYEHKLNKLYNILFRVPLDSMPLWVNDPQVALYAKWRLKIGR